MGSVASRCSVATVTVSSDDARVCVMKEVTKNYMPMLRVVMLTQSLVEVSSSGTVCGTCRSVNSPQSQYCFMCGIDLHPAPM